MAESITSIVELNIFDFDGTLFKSPTPNPNIWDRSSIGKLKAPPAAMNFRGQQRRGNDSGGVGWFQDPITLSPPFVPEAPEPYWFITHVVEKVRRSLANQPLSVEDGSTGKCITVLLTGRTVSHLDRIKRIVAALDLAFDEYGLKPLGGSDTTMAFKQKFITNLVSLHQPTHINIFEDRIEHFKKFDEFLRKNFRGINSKVHFVDEPDGETALPKTHEAELVKTLLQKYAPALTISETVNYTAVILSPESRKRLLEKFPVPEDWRVYGHHMTITLGPISQAIAKDLPVSGKLGTTVTLKVEALGKSDKAMAVKVSGFYSTNHIHHVTLAVSAYGKPVDSNFITEWTPVTEYEAIELVGIVEEVSRLQLVAGVSPKKSSSSSPSKGGYRFPVGSVIRKYHPSVAGPDMASAISEVTKWMQEMKIDGSGATHVEVESFIKEKKSWTKTTTTTTDSTLPNGTSNEPLGNASVPNEETTPPQ